MTDMIHVDKTTPVELRIDGVEVTTTYGGKGQVVLKLSADVPGTVMALHVAKAILDYNAGQEPDGP
jgi:stringent starvation protein B